MSIAPSILVEEYRRKAARVVLGGWLTLSVALAVTGSIIAAVLDLISDRVLKVAVAVVSPITGMIAAVAVVFLVIAGPAGGKVANLFRPAGSDVAHRIALVLTAIPVTLGLVITYSQLQKVAEYGGLSVFWSWVFPASVIFGLLAPLAGIVVMQSADDEFIRDAIDNETAPVIPPDPTGAVIGVPRDHDPSEITTALPKIFDDVADDDSATAVKQM